MTEPSSTWSRKKILTILPLIAAIIIVVVLVKTKKGPDRLPLVESSKPVRFITVKTIDLVPRVIGYGKAEPAEVWQAVAQVSGRIVELSPELEQGNLCKKGTFLARIDPVEYELAVVKMEASIEEVKAKISELNTEEKKFEGISVNRKKITEIKQERTRQAGEVI
jgi:multidrug efflux pump subunit AcrA (membrane-fusion protein)